MLEVKQAKNLSSNALPDSLHPGKIPDVFKAAENGKLEYLPEGEPATLPGDNKGSAHKLPNEQVYACVADIVTRFPAEGKVAINVMCMEKLTLLEGALDIKINGKTTTLEKGSFVVIAPGDSYELFGNGKIIVITDNQEGFTLTVSQFPEPEPTTSREAALKRAFLKYLITAESNVAGAREFRTLAIDPRTCPLEMVGVEEGFKSGLRTIIKKIEAGPGEYFYEDKKVYDLKEGEIGVTYHWADVAFLSGGGGSAHRKLRVLDNGNLESIEREIYSIFMS